MSSSLRKTLVCLALAFAFLPTYAQVATGQYPLGTFDSLGPEVINVGNLNLMLNIPVLHKTGRAGTNFTYDLSYNSGLVWSPLGGAWQGDQNWGWEGTTEVVTGQMFIAEVDRTCIAPPGSTRYPVSTISGVHYVDAAGVNHKWGGSVVMNGCDPSENHNGISNTWSIDGKYKMMTAIGVIQDAQGRTISPPQTGTGVGTYTDLNGNSITSDGAGNFTDTTGVVALVVTGAAPSNQTYSYTDSSGTNRAVTVSYVTHTVTTNFGCSGITEYSASSIPLVDTITLADATTYKFTYESTPGVSGAVTGRIATITLPSLGVITYTYTGANNGINCNDGSPMGMTRTLTTAGTPARTYTRSSISTAASDTTVVDSMGNQSVYTFITGSTPLGQGLELYPTSVAVTSGTSGTPLLARAICYNSASAPCTTQSLTLPITQTDESDTWDGIAQNGTTRVYDANGNPSSVTAYDFGTSSRGSSLLVENTSYSGGLLQLDQTYVGGTLSKNVQYTYDTASLQPTSGVPQHTAGTNAGNLSTVSISLQPWTTPAGIMATSYTYYDTGSLYTQTDSSGATTTYAYDSTNTHPLTVTPPDPNGVGMSTSLTYDTYVGNLKTSTNPNGVVTTYTSSDGSGHASQVVAALGGTTYAKATGQATPTFSQTLSYQNGTTSSESDVYADSYGRPIWSFSQSEPGYFYSSYNCYNSNSQLSFQSYPTKVTASSIASLVTSSPTCSGSGDAYTYDALGRTLSVTHGDSPQTSVSYTYLGGATKVVDENGVTHISQNDGAGRLSIVCEVTSGSLNGVSPASCGTAISGTGFVTTYAYSASGYQITQGSQTRTFELDAAGRLTKKQEPEGNWVNYGYTYNTTGPITARRTPKAGQTDTSGATGTVTNTAIQYDTLGRVLSVTYDDGLTPTKTYTYDVAPSGSSFAVGYAKGLMTSASSANGSSTLFAYDQLGRVQNMSQCVPNWCGVSQPPAMTRGYGYDGAGNMLSETFSTPAGTASLGYQVNLAGQLTQVSGGQDSSITSPLYSATTETPFGPTASSLGNGFSAALSYDPLGRKNGMALSRGGTTKYSYSATWQGQHVTGSTDSVNGTATYSYDDLNRLGGASIITTAGTLGLFWTYDRYGNRLTQTPSGSYTVSVNTVTTPVDATTNRLSAPGLSYDAVGNLMSDGINSYTYDAEGNLLSVTGGTTASFTYDALNQRVVSTVGGATKVYGYNAAGKRATVWDASGNLISAQYYAGNRPLAYYLTSDGHVRFQHQDWVGTERYRTRYTATMEGSFSTLPFGDSQAVASGTDSNADANHFADLDYVTQDMQNATFRTYSATNARWLRPDPYTGSYDLSDPQSFNRYAYVAGKPLIFSDPSGWDYFDENGNLCTQDDDPNADTSVTCWGGDGSEFGVVGGAPGLVGNNGGSTPNNGTPKPAPSPTPQQPAKQPWFCGTGNSWSHPFTAPTGKQWGIWSTSDLIIAAGISKFTGGKDPVSQVFIDAGLLEAYGWAKCD